mmetsp:Transcript_13131/g.25820  ORF Transcript_13131/g.25820 Transcript_13131/m.25820 type:complete len:96 (+) Transcript_13131:486-773(+)
MSKKNKQDEKTEREKRKSYVREKGGRKGHGGKDSGGTREKKRRVYCYAALVHSLFVLQYRGSAIFSLCVCVCEILPCLERRERQALGHHRRRPIA